ncbi:hypothetical protein [Halobacterium zhouii]|uniref:hypothetical protein n=1 Tax=Halobacterium zhouii TaxID=2902624 RepID=UPI001E612B90|nr:hypothetical protein [Halobacterium zhouii]
MTPTLDERDRVVLESLRRGNADIESLADNTDTTPEALQDRLVELADNGLVERADAGGYALTANGERVLVATPAGTADDRIDTPPDVERVIESFDLRPDREAAVRGAHSFLHYWGAATDSEIVDAVYSEVPAGFDGPDEWWAGFVRERLEALPSVEPPRSPDGEWQYSGTPIVEEETDDGRLLFEDEAVTRSSVKFALERLDLTDAERAAVREAFRVLAHEGEVTAADVVDRVYADHDAGYDSPDGWWADCVRPAFEAFPGVERVDENTGTGEEQSDETEEGWRYQSSDEG